jgi:GntR family transcriptional regulator
LAAGQQVLVRRRHYILDEKPVQLAVTYYSADLVRGSAIEQENTGPGGAYARLAELGVAPVHFREELLPRMPRPSEVDALRLSQGTPVVHLVRTAYTADRRAVEVNEIVLDASAFIFEYHFSADE